MRDLLVPNLQPPNGRRKPNYPLATLTWVGGPCTNCKQTLGILWMMSCNSSWRIPAGRSLSESWMHPPETHHQHLGEILWETGILMLMTGRSPFWEGEGGFPQSSHFDLLPLHNRMEGGNPEDPPAPIQPNEDVGHLINMLAMGLWLGTPQINTFSGEATPGKTEVLFEWWYHEVQCVKDHYPESVFRESIVHSVKGAAVDMARYMDPTSSMAILQKVTIIFGTVALFDVLMQNFYKITQSNHEMLPSFATRLEETLNQIR